jgi:hypothetical protein
MIKMADKRADLAGPGIGSYEEIEKILPKDYIIASQRHPDSYLRSEAIYRRSSLQGT